MGQSGVVNVVVLGRIGAPFGIGGWVHFHSYTEPPENILSYPLWQIRRNSSAVWQPKKVVQARPHGKHFVALLEGCTDRVHAASLTNADIGVPREDLPELSEGEHYWTDLIGLKVVSDLNIYIGTVKSLFETGANDVLVVQGETKEHLIPYIPGEYILSIDKASQTITVHWDPEF